MRMTTKRLLTAALAGLGVAAAAACSGPAVSAPSATHTSAAAPGATPSASAAAPSSASSQAGSNASAPTASTSYCTRAPASMIHDTLGLTVGKLVPVVDGPVAVCAYTGKYEVIVRFQINENASQFGQDQKTSLGSNQTVATVSGLGDGAFSATTSGHPAPLYTLAARKGTVAVFITSPASLTAERSLMTRLLAQL